jgi:hypothetical protein
MPAERMDQFCADFSAFRLDEVLGTWKPYHEVIGTALERTASGGAYPSALQTPTGSMPKSRPGHRMPMY